MADLDLLIVNPGGSRKRVYQELGKDFAAIEPPFWAALTAGFIKNQGHSVDILDANAKNLDYDEAVTQIGERDPELVNIVVYGQHPSASTQLMTSVEGLCKKIKEINPEQKIILTGLHPSALPQLTLEEGECDFVCQGEGFHTLDGLLKGQEVSKIPGLWYKQEGQVMGNKRATNIKNLTLELGDVAWDLLDLKDGGYKAHNWQCLDDFSARPNYVSLSTSLGCPFKCDFCSIHKTFGERAVRFWEPEWVVDQMTDLAENYGVKVFKIIDELFILKPKHYLPIAEGLIERGLGKEINTWVYSRVDTVKEEHLDKLREAGFKWFCLGFESGNEDILKEEHKGSFTRQDMVDVADKFKNHGINVLANYMFGFPQDTLETMQQTLDLAVEQNCEFANFYCAIAWPGSLLYEESLKSGKTMPEKWGDYAQHAYGFHPLPTSTLSPRQVLSFRDKAFDTFFSNPQYLHEIENKFGLKAREHIQEMTKHKLKRRLLEDCS